MKRFLCVLLCLLLLAPAALADDYTPTQLFRQQFIVGGNGLRGSLTVTASGVAPWLDLLMPFAGAKLQVRIIGEKQGARSELVTDDEDWQIKLWAKDDAGEAHGLTNIYGNPDGLYIFSELIPGTLLTVPVKGVNLPYQLSDGELPELALAFDLPGIEAADNGGNATPWTAMTGVASISEETWEAEWTPVLQKYDTLMDMWLSAYASPTVVTSGASGMTLRTTWEIPVKDVKEQTKYIIGLMLSDTDLQTLMAPHLTDAQRSLYLNPAMLWFYEHCIDIVPLSGSILLERETTAKGDTTAMSISMPLPPLPQELTDSMGQTVAQVFGLEDAKLFEGLDRISVRQAGGETSISLSSPSRTITFIIAQSEEGEEGVRMQGFFRVTPAVGVQEPPLSAAFTYESTCRIWEDEEYKTHEDYTWALTLAPDTSLVTPDDPFHSSYVQFAPISLSASVAYTKKEKANSPVQVVIEVNATLPDAEVSATANLKVAERWERDDLPVTGGEDLTRMSPERREELRNVFIDNATRTMTTLNAVPAGDPAQ